MSVNNKLIKISHVLLKYFIKLSVVFYSECMTPSWSEPNFLTNKMSIQQTKWVQDLLRCFVMCFRAHAGIICTFMLAVKEGAWENWCLIGACRWDLLLPVSVRITSSHPAQSYCLTISQSLWHHSISSPFLPFFCFPLLPWLPLPVVSLFSPLSLCSILHPIFLHYFTFLSITLSIIVLISPQSFSICLSLLPVLTLRRPLLF